MPIYEYLCKKCDTQFEVMQSIAEKPLKKCKADGCSGKVERLVSATGFILKGSGWYSSDYPSESRKKGWESEQKIANGGGDAGGHSCGSGCGHNHGPTPPADSAPETPPKVAKDPKKTKNPYSGGKKSRKTAGAS